MTPPSRLRHLAPLLLAALSAGCGDSKGGGLGPSDPDQYQRLLTCLPPCLARVFAQQGCGPSGACTSGSGGICYANGVKVSITRADGSAATTSTTRKSDGAVCYAVSIEVTGGAGTSTFRSATGDTVATVKHDATRASLWTVTCDGKTETFDTDRSPCKEALRIPGAGECTSGACP
jgi:hypothetical protein